MTVLLPHYKPKAHNVKNPRSKMPWQVLFSTTKGVWKVKKLLTWYRHLLKSE